MVLEDRLEDQELRASFCESDIAGPRRRALAESGTSSTVSPKSRSSESMSLPVSLDLAKPVAFRVSFPGRAVRAGSPAAGGGAIGTLGLARGLLWRIRCLLFAGCTAHISRTTRAVQRGGPRNQFIETKSFFSLVFSARPGEVNLEVNLEK